MLPKEDRKNLCWAMRKTLIDAIESNPTLTEAGIIAAKNFVVNEASYDDLLNLTYNPNRANEYLPASVLEEAAVEQYRKYIIEAAEQAAEEEAAGGEEEEGEAGAPAEGTPTEGETGDAAQAEEEANPAAVQESVFPQMASSYLFLRETSM